jgi:hypothetical protein
MAIQNPANSNTQNINPTGTSGLPTIDNHPFPTGTPAVIQLIDNAASPAKTYNFPFNLNSLTWSYQLNSQSYDTVGGRVTQLLSVRINTLELQGEAGTRENLINLYNNFKIIQNNQNINRVSATLNVPSRHITHRVWLETMQLQWDITTVTYPYVMRFEVEQDVTNSVVDALSSNAIDLLQSGIGFSGQWTGVSSTDHNIAYASIKVAIQNGIIGKNG